MNVSDLLFSLISGIFPSPDDIVKSPFPVDAFKTYISNQTKRLVTVKFTQRNPSLSADKGDILGRDTVAVERTLVGKRGNGLVVGDVGQRGLAEIS